MCKKLLTVVVAAMVALLPFQGQLYAITFTATGEVNLSSTFNATLVGGTGGQLVFSAGNAYATGNGYVEVTFNDNATGYRAITISTDNRGTSANPLYNGIAQGNGMVGTGTAGTATSGDQTVPLLWMVNATVSAYTFTGAAGEYFVTDQKMGTDATNDPTKGSSKCNDTNKNGVCETGEYTDRNSNGAYDAVMWDGVAANSYNCKNGSKYADACQNHSSTPKDVEGIDWDGDGYDGAKPYSQGYAAAVFGISGQSGELSAAAGSTVTSGRTVTNGTARIYVGANYDKAKAQKYKTNQLKVEIVTIA